MISGLNHFSKWNCGGNSYFFTRNGAAITGWGTWKRIWNEYDYQLNALNDKYLCTNAKKGFLKYESKKGKGTWKGYLNVKKKLDSGIKFSAWDIQFGFMKQISERVGIAPSVNLIHNIGVGEKSTHDKCSRVRPWRPGMVTLIPVSEMKFPLVHPKYVFRDFTYEDQLLKYFKPSPYWIVRTTKRGFRFLRRMFRKH